MREREGVREREEWRRRRVESEQQREREGKLGVALWLELIKHKIK